MKLIIAGGRNFSSREATQHVFQAMGENHIYQLHQTPVFEDADNKFVTEIVSGGALGMDTAGEVWAKTNGVEITQFLPNYKLLGSMAPRTRNKQMAIYADILRLIWDGKSSGSAHMKREMSSLGKPIIEKVV